jgi:hypothetical protein
MGYFDDTCSSCLPLPRPFVVSGVSRAITVLNEAALLALQPGELNVGDYVIIVLPTTYTKAYGVVMFTNSLASGWGQFSIMGNPTAGSLTEAQFVAFVDSLPPAPPVGGGAWNNGGAPTVS